MTRTVPEVIAELPAVDQAAIERRAGEMADAERRIEIMRRGAATLSPAAPPSRPGPP
jgi:hypothetical protein